MRHTTLLSYSLAILLLAIAPALTHALPFVGEPSPIPGYGADDGTELWLPNSSIVSLEVIDFFGATTGVESSFGFYRASDPSTLITIFSAVDQDGGGNPQSATIDFAVGVVTDNDQAVQESTFAPGFSAIGFYLELVTGPSSTDVLTLFTQAVLNDAIGGADAFASWESDTMPGTYLLGAEFEEAGLALRADIITDIRPVSALIPEPNAALVFALGFLVTGVAVRRRASQSGS